MKYLPTTVVWQLSMSSGMLCSFFIFVVSWTLIVSTVKPCSFNMLTYPPQQPQFADLYTVNSDFSAWLFVVVGVLAQATKSRLTIASIRNSLVFIGDTSVFVQKGIAVLNKDRGVTYE